MVAAKKHIKIVKKRTSNLKLFYIILGSERIAATVTARKYSF